MDWIKPFSWFILAIFPVPTFSLQCRDGSGICL